MSQQQEKTDSMDVGWQSVANAYAEALLNAAEKRQLGQQILDELESLVTDVCLRDPLVDTFLASSIIGRGLKDAVLEAAFQGRCSDLVEDFLRVLNEHDRLDLLRQMVGAYRALLNQRAGRIRVQVQTAVPLPQDQLERVRQQVREQFHNEPMVETSIAPELLGGMVVRVGDWLYDGSIRTRLVSLRNQLTA